MKEHFTFKLRVILFAFLTLLGQMSIAQLCTDPPDSLNCGAGIPLILSIDDFETGLGTFVQSTTDDINWIIASGPTTSEFTGPSDDFCGGGNYLYVETSFPVSDGNVACLSTSSDLTSLISTDPAIVSFGFHAFGECMGNFVVSINGATPITLVSGQVQTATTNPWEQIVLDLDGLQGTVVTFEFCYTAGTTGVNGCGDVFNGDFAIDQFTVWTCIPPCMITCSDEVSVSNDLGQCEATIDGATIGVATFEGGCVGPDAINDYTGTADAGGVYPLGTTTITWTINGVAGEVVTCTQDITVLDAEAPILDCPANTTLSLDGGECDNAYYFSAEAIDNCDGALVALPDPNAPAGYNVYVSGELLPIGEHCFQYESTDGVGNQSICSWCVTVAEYPDPISQLSCNSNLNHAVNLDCELIITPDMILEGGLYGCYENYIVTVVGITPATAVVDNETNAVTIKASQIDGFIDNGMAGPFEIKITDPATGVSCWGAGHIFEDKTAPSIQCDTVELACTDDITPGVIAQEPVVTENCGVYALIYEDNATAGSCSDQYANVIERTWTVSDNIGNSAQCVQIINVNFAELADVEFPENLDNLELPALSCEDANIDPSITGEPTGVSCGNIGFTHSDSDSILLCGGGSGSFKIIRTWTVLDWCSGEIITDQQIIKVLDEVAPEINCPANMDVSTANEVCEASVLIQGSSIEVTDVCSATIGLTASISAGSIVPNGVNWLASGLGIGTHTVSFTATDECGNTASCSFDISVYDGTNPVAICETFHTVSLTADQPTLVYANVFDANSNDNCSPISMDVRRMDSCIDFDWTTEGPGFDDTSNAIINDADRGIGNSNSQTAAWYPAVPFACCDAGSEVMVAFRVTDESGNRNTCMVTVMIEDNLDGTISCPVNKDYDCEMDILESSDLSLDGVSVIDNGGLPAYYFTGAAWELVGYYLDGYDNCSANVFILDRGGINSCGESYLTNPDIPGDIRRYYAVYPGGTAVANVPTTFSELISQSDDFCTQLLGVQNLNNFDESDIIFPSTVTVSCPTNPTNTGAPIISEDACSNVAVTQEPDIIVPLNDDTACYKILRNWIVIDWCAYDGSGAGYWESLQVIKVQDNVAPSIDSDCIDQTFFVDTDNDGNFTNGCTAPVVMTAEGSDVCVGATGLEWSWEIDASDNGTIDFSGSGNTLSGTYPSGSHRVTWTLSDACGNVDQCTYLFNVIDNTGPLVYGESGLEVGLVDQGGGVGTATIWAVDFDEGSSDECSGICDMRIASPSLGGGQLVPPTTSSVTFDCTNLGNNTIDFWVKDCANNWRYISTFVAISDVNGVCNGITSGITGNMTTEMGEGVEGVSVDLSGYMTSTMMTDEDGLYSFSGLPLGQNYTVTPSENLPILNGVSTYDLVLMSKHILDVELLDSPYKMIAADVNSSGSITTFDMVELRKLILFIEDEFPVNNASWRFVPADFVFPDPTDPWLGGTFPELYSINEMEGSTLADFVAIKKGDVNNSAVPNALLGSDDRSILGTLALEVDDIQMQEGETYIVDFRAKNFNQLFGYQFSLDFDGNSIEFDDLSVGDLINLSEGNFGLSKLHEGVITTSWNNEEPVVLTDNEVVFSLSFKALSNVLLSEVLQINSRYTVAEAYNVDLELLDVAIEYDNNLESTAEIAFELLQNQPNPFRTETVVGFTLKEAESARLKVFDISGRVLLEITDNYNEGYSEIVINRSDLQASGVVYYQLDTNTGSAIRKMIIID